MRWYDILPYLFIPFPEFMTVVVRIVVVQLRWKGVEGFVGEILQFSILKQMTFSVGSF